MEVEPVGGGDEGVADCEVNDDEAMEVTNANNESDDEVLQAPRASHCFYNIDDAKQGYNITKEEVETMMKAVPYQRKIDTCHLCSKCWYDNIFSADCRECGGFAMSRPCPICFGQCSQTWKRNVKLSHSFHEAYWDGVCDLPPDLQPEQPVDTSEDGLSESLQDLSTNGPVKEDPWRRMKRKDQAVIFALRTGHSDLRGHLARINPRKDTTSPVADEDQQKRDGGVLPRSVSHSAEVVRLLAIRTFPLGLSLGEQRAAGKD